ncbi:MAG: Glycosyl transferase WecB/TagA/CpsF family [uncultured bacterium]|nr:MAG: Glycosyl transferase WecB/TagA/CpsF family [uncultured bacterium]HBR71308.1 hypothetical protein [Candidatus Moranbacteria bacterium]
MNILGIRVDNFSKKEILEKIEFFLTEEKPCLPTGRFHQVATINPEFVLEAQNDKQFKDILNDCSLNIADGIGIFFAFLRFGKLLRHRIAGIDLMDKILKIAQKKNLSVFLVANKNGLSSWEETRDAILNKYPKLKINGLNLNSNITDFELPVTDYSIVFCNFGAPEQEIFINSLKNANIKVAMGVGGSFDFITGKITRAPKFMRKVGLEWLFRLILEPRYRFRRIFQAVVVFPIKILLGK